MSGQKLDTLGKLDDVRRFEQGTGAGMVGAGVLVIAGVIVAILTQAWWLIGGAGVALIGMVLLYRRSSSVVTVTVEERRLIVLGGHEVPLIDVAAIGFGDGSQSTDPQEVRWARDFGHPTFADNHGHSRFVVIRLRKRIRGVGRDLVVPLEDAGQASRVASMLRKQVAEAQPAAPFR